MHSYLITYDLLKPCRDYRSLHQAILTLDCDAWHGFESVWVIRSFLPIQSIRDFLATYSDANDRLAVFLLQSGWAAKNLPFPYLLAQNTGTIVIAA